MTSTKYINARRLVNLSFQVIQYGPIAPRLVDTVDRVFDELSADMQTSCSQGLCLEEAGPHALFTSMYFNIL